MATRSKPDKQPKAKPTGKFSQTYAARIKVVGVGGGGGNAVSRMARNFSVKNIDFIAINTDAQDLDFCDAKHKIYIGKNLTRGLGTGMNPDIGRQAAEENRSEIAEILKDADLVFITAGLGGGTGSGASPVIAEVAKEAGILTVAVVTRPFSFEGSQRSRIAQEALMKLKEKVDTLIVVPNDRIFSIIQKDTPLIKAFEYIDDVLRSAVQGIAEVIAMPGIVNVDFADVRTIMQDAGSALVGIGLANGQDRAMAAVSQAVNSPLLEVSIDGAKGVLLGISGGRDMKMSEVNDIAKRITEAVDPAAKIIFGAYHDRNLEKGKLRVTLIATGFNGHSLNGTDASSTSLFTLQPEPVVSESVVLEKEEALKKAKDKKKESGDIWDIPTFLRKKRK
jgi:cell division protein FtsZ